MESQSTGRYVPQKSKKRASPEGSSAIPDVIEIPPPKNQSSKSKTLKITEITNHEIIDLDVDEKDGEIILTNEGFALKYNKGKGAITNNAVAASSAFNRGSVDGVQSVIKSSDSGSHNIVNLDGSGSNSGSGSDILYHDDDYADMYYGSMQADDSQLYNDEYAFLQSQFDNIDIPPGVEAPVPWFVSPGQKITNVATINASNQSIPIPQHSPGGFPLGMEASHFPWTADPWGQMSTTNISAMKAPVHVASHPQKAGMSSLWSTAENGQSKNGLAAYSGWGFNNISTFSGVANSHGPHNTPGSSQQYSGVIPVFGSVYIPDSISNTVSNNSVLLGPYMHTATEVYTVTEDWSNWNMHPMASSEYPTDFNPFFTEHVSSEEVAYELSGPDSPPVDLGISIGSSSTSHQNATTQHISEDEIVKKFQQFKNFDIVQDPSDHHYVHNGSSLKQPSRSWSKKIQGEWKILEKDLPDTIYVRAYESRMDLLRAVIVGAEGTPYHDGLFFFDVFFPDSYPNVPPQVYYHSRGLRLNPNLYNNGKVCLSLLNTWSGSQKEMWIPKLSTMLQVLVSIQGLILNAKPYFNEPAYANSGSTPQGIKNSDHYNESTFIYSLKTMVFTLRKPPKHYEDFVMGHFFKNAQAILVACKAYMEGAQVGCLVRGGVQDVDQGDKSCSQQFKAALGQYLKTLADAFTHIGVKDCQQYIPPPQTKHSQKGKSRVRQVGKAMSPALKAVHYFA